jgi:hypothetical protein
MEIAAFETFVGMVAVCFGMVVLLAACALYHIRSFMRRFHFYDEITEKSEIVYIFIVIRRFEVNVEHWEWQRTECPKSSSLKN